MPLEDCRLISIKTGMRNNGSADAYMATLKVYYDSLEAKTKELNSLLSEGDMANYVIKVHALKSSLRIIGAADLGEEAQDLENAGKAGEISFIKERHEGFIKGCQSLGEPLAEIFGGDRSAEEKPVADAGYIADIYEKMKDAAEDMDFDSLEDIVEEMSGFAIPENEVRRWEDIKKSVAEFDYDGVLKLL